MRVINFIFTKDGNTLRLIENTLSDDSKVYDIEILDDDDVVFKTACYDKKDAEKRFSNFSKALSL